MHNLRLRGVIIVTVLLLFFTPNISTLNAASKVSTTTKSTSSKYGIAVPILFGVTLTDITPNFGEPRGGGARTHEGLDIMAPEGTPIVSPVKGTVQGYGTAANPGKYVYVRGSDGHMYGFMHLHEIAKLKRGQKLKVGDVIGTVGETGNAKGTTPHLHFEIKKGKPLDPYMRIKKEFTLEEKIEFLNNALDELRGDEELVKLMVERYRGLLVLAESKKLKLDTQLTTAMKKSKGGVSMASTTVGLRSGSSGEQVVTLQNALIKANMGPVAYRLAQAGATGYFGGITESALREYQTISGLVPTGIFDIATRTNMLILYN